MSLAIHCVPINAMGELRLVSEPHEIRQLHQDHGHDSSHSSSSSNCSDLGSHLKTSQFEISAHSKPQIQTTPLRGGHFGQLDYYYHRPSQQDEQKAKQQATQREQQQQQQLEQLEQQLEQHHQQQQELYEERHTNMLFNGQHSAEPSSAGPEQAASPQRKQRAAVQLVPQQPTADTRHRLSTIQSNTHTGHLLEVAVGSGQLAPKMRSFSHSNTFAASAAAAAATSLSTSLSSTGSSPGSSSGRHSAASSCQENVIEHQEGANSADHHHHRLAGHTGGAQQQLSAPVTRVRRLSRIEHRQSLHDLGYGKIESYFKLQRLGKGTYATVYMGRSRLSNDLVALKEILKEHDEGAPCTAIREVSLLRFLLHNNIVTLHDICHTPKKLTLVFEYVGPDLYTYMKENNNLLSIHNVRLLLYQLLRGISFCHSRQVLHRDLKPQNLLINARGELKICDFGLARAKSIPTKSYSNEVVTLWYRPPDVLLGNTDYDHSIDMWGVGCIFYEMASGRTFFPGSSVRQQLYLIFSSLGAPNRHNWPEILHNADYQSYSFPYFRPEKLAHRVPRLDSNGLSLLMSFLRFKPSERISAEQARRHTFFSSLPEQVHHLSERESIFDVPGVYITLNPGQKLSGHHM